MWGVMIMAIDLIQEARFSILRVSKKCVIFDLFLFCWSTYHYSYPLTICMSLKDVYQRRIMPLLEGRGKYLTLPRQFSLFFGTSWCIDSGGFWGYYLNSHLDQSKKTNNTTINQYERADSIVGGGNCVRFGPAGHDFHYFLVGGTGRDLTLDSTQQKTQQ